MASIKHKKTNQIPDWTQQQLNAICDGLPAPLPPIGTTLNQVTLPSDWNADHDISGLIESIQPGTGITVDNTDPANPIISAIGGGGSPGGNVNDIQFNDGAGGFSGTDNATLDIDGNIIAATFSGSFFGNGSGLTDVPITADGTTITGSGTSADPIFARSLLDLSSGNTWTFDNATYGAWFSTAGLGSTNQVNVFQTNGSILGFQNTGSSGTVTDLQMIGYNASNSDLSQLVTLNTDATGNFFGKKFVTNGGTSSQFVKGDGSLDSTSYLPSSTGGYVNNATNTTLTRSGTGPYTLGINLGNANTWTAEQKIQSTTEQFRIGYDSTNYTTFTESSSGTLTMAGATGGFTFNPATNASNTFNTSVTTPSVNFTQTQFIANYNPSTDTGTTTTYDGAFFKMQKSNASNMTNDNPLTALGMQTYNNGSGNIRTAAGFTAQVSNDGTGVITNSYVIRAIGSIATQTNNMTNVYGIYLDGQKSANVGTGYGVYQAGSSDLNQFNGISTFANTTILSSLTASTALALDGSKNIVSVTNTGTGNNVLATSPTLVTPNLGTPSAITLTNATGLPLTTGTTGVLPETKGGTNQSTYTLGDTLYSSASNTLSKLAGNTTTTKQFLTQTGTGTVSAAPAWSALVSADIPNNAANTTGSAAKWTTARNLAGNSVDGSTNVPFANKFIVQGTTDAGLSGAQFLGSLGTGLVKNTTTTGVLSIAAAGTDYQAPLTFSTGLTNTSGTITVNTSQNIATLSNLTANGFVKTSGGTGALSIDTNTYLTANQTITLSGAVTGSGTTAITTSLGSFTSSALATALTDETGSGSAVFATSPTITGATEVGMNKASTIAFGTGTATGTFSGVLLNNTNAAGSPASGTGDLISYTIPANTFATNGNALRIQAGGRFVGNANTKSLQFVFNGVTITSRSASSGVASNWVFEGYIYRNGSSTQLVYSRYFCDGTTLIAPVRATATGTDTAGIIVKFTGTGVTASDVVQDYMLIEAIN